MSAEERRRLLVDAAIEVMCREGVEHTTTRAIVAQAGMQIGVFHYCFRSKEELVLEVVQTITRRTFASVAGVLGRSNDPAELIRLAIEAYWTDLENKPMEQALAYELTHHTLREPGEEHVARAQYADYYAGLEEFLSRVASIGGFRWATPVDELARYAFATISGLTLQWLVSRDEVMTRRLLDQLGAYLCSNAGLVAA